MLHFKADLDSPYYPVLKQREIKYSEYFGEVRCKYCNDQKIWVIVGYPIVKIPECCCEDFKEFIKSRIRKLDAS